MSSAHDMPTIKWTQTLSIPAHYLGKMVFSKAPRQLYMTHEVLSYGLSTHAVEKKIFI